MDNIRNVVFLQFRDVTKQNGSTSVGTLYREPLGERAVCYDNVYKNQKGLRWGIYSIIDPYERTFVRIKDFWSAFLLEVILHRYRTFTTSYVCYLMIPCPKHYKLH